jgi:hypothetical protein
MPSIDVGQTTSSSKYVSKVKSSDVQDPTPISRINPNTGVRITNA